MKFLCAACHQLSALAHAVLEGNALVAACEHCGAESRQELEQSARTLAKSVKTEVGIPAGYCPKCIAPSREGSISCTHCGLAWGSYRAANFFLSEATRGLWLQALADYENRPLHLTLIQMAESQGELALLGRLYRMRLAHFPEEAPAKFARDEILRRASIVTVPQGPSAPRPDAIPPRGRIRMPIVVGLAALIPTLVGIYLGVHHKP